MTGAAAPIALTGAIQMCFVPSAMRAPAEPALGSTYVYVGAFTFISACKISTAAPNSPPGVSISRM